MQLKTDVEVYNDMNKGKDPRFNLFWTSLMTLQERQVLDERGKRAARRGKAA